MICNSCKAAGTLLEQALAHGEVWRVDALHAYCPGASQCDCQHDTSATAFRRDRLPDPRRGS